MLALLVLVVILIVASPSVAQPQEPSCPIILKELYFPASLTVTFTSQGMVGLKKNIASTKPNLPYTYSETSTGPPQNQLTVSWMTTNMTDTWTIDLFLNYTAPTPQYIAYTATEVDSTGIPKMHQDSCYTGTDQVWVRFIITTRVAPRPPTLNEMYGWMLQPGNLLVNTLDTNTQNVGNLASIVWLTFGVAAAGTFVVVCRAVVDILRFITDILRGGD